MKGLSLLYCILAFAILGQFSCSKDKTTPVCFKWSDYNYPIISATDRQYFYRFPHFNPNNKDEIVFFRGDQVNQIGAFEIYNLHTHTLKVVFTSSKIWYSARWSSKNWFVFGLQAVVYKIKSNGDSLTQLTFSGSKDFPSWNHDGSKIIFHTNEGASGMGIIDESGNILTQINGSSFHAWADWSLNNGLMLTSNGSNQIRLFNDSALIVNSFYLSDAVYDLCWVDSENVFLIMKKTTGEGSIYRYNIVTQQKHLIKEGCSTRAYSSITISPDKQKIIAETIEYTVNQSDKTIETHTEFYLMNIDGTNEQHIELPKY